MRELRTRIAAVTSLVFLAACGGSESFSTDGAGAEGQPEIGKYEQTWPKDYGATSCGEWHKKMDEHQQFVAGADMISNLWGADGVKGQLPPDPLVNAFAANISVACEANAQIKISEVGATLYITAKDQFGPP